VYGRGLNVSSAGLKKLRSGAEKRRRLRGRDGEGDAKDDVEASAEKEADARGRVLVIAMGSSVWSEDEQQNRRAAEVVITAMRKRTG
jgi:hypothetical protein